MYKPVLFFHIKREFLKKNSRWESDQREKNSSLIQKKCFKFVKKWRKIVLLVAKRPKFSPAAREYPPKASY